MAAVMTSQQARSISYFNFTVWSVGLPTGCSYGNVDDWLRDLRLLANLTGFLTAYLDCRLACKSFAGGERLLGCIRGFWLIV